MTALKHKQIVLLLAGLLACLIFHLQWIIPVALAANGQERVHQIKIKVNAASNVKTPRIFLGDIADITASPFLMEAIENIDIGTSPKPEKIKVIDKRKIIFQLKSQKYLSKNFTLICPDKVFVKRLGQTIKKQQIEAFIHQQLEDRFQNKDYLLQQFNIRGLKPYPKGNILFNIDAEKMVDRKGRLYCYLDVIVNGVKFDRLSISGMVAVYENIVFAARSLSKGDKLSREDVYIKKENIFNFNLSVIHAIDAVDGKVLKSSVRKDTSLIGSILSDPPLVRKGDIVTLIAKNKNLKIITSGISKEDGFKNELIKVENFRSGKLIRGIVIEKSKVEIVY